MREAWFNIGLDIVHMDTCGSITAIIKPVRNQVTGEIQRWNQEAYRSPYERMGKPSDRKNKTA